MIYEGLDICFIAGAEVAEEAEDKERGEAREGRGEVVEERGDDVGEMVVVVVVVV